MACLLDVCWMVRRGRSCTRAAPPPHCGARLTGARPRPRAHAPPRPWTAAQASDSFVESTLALPFGGDGARVVARGSFEAEGPELAVTVSDVSIEAGGRSLRLPLGGTGATTLVYGGRDVRVLRGGSGGALAVQVRSGALE